MSDNRTLEPTLRRRQQARQEGRVAATPWLSAAITWLAVFVLGYGCADWLSTVIVDASATADSSVASGIALDEASLLFVANLRQSGSMAGHDLQSFVRQTMLGVAVWLVPCLLAIVGLATLGRIAQVGFMWVPKRVSPDVSRVQPSNRLGNLLSFDALFQCARGLLLIGLILGLLSLAIWEGRESINLLSQRDIASSIRFVCQWGVRLGGVLLLFALLDYAYQYRRFDASLKMTVEEMRSEVKAVEGSGALVAERRKQYQHSLQSMRTAETPSP